MAAKSSKTPEKSKAMLIAHDTGLLAGLSSDLSGAARLLKSAKERCVKLEISHLLTGPERVSMTKLRINCDLCLAQLKDWHPAPKQIEAALTMRENGVENFEVEE